MRLFTQATQKWAPGGGRPPAAAVLFCLLAAAAVLLLGGCNARKVQTVAVEAEANQIIDVLGENGIRARKQEVGEGNRKVYEILISGDDDDLAAAIQLMQDHCLGQPELAPIESSGVIASAEVEKAQEQRRTKLNIEAQLRKLPGVTCVDVNFVPPQDKSLALNPYSSTAAVIVNYKTPTFPKTSDEIARLVARSVPDLKPENVEVTLSAKPLRPLPENRTSYNFTRIALIASIGFATILAFVSIVFYLQKKRAQTDAAEADRLETEEDRDAREAALLKDGYDFDEDDEVNLP